LINKRFETLNHVAVATIPQCGGRFRGEPLYVANHLPPQGAAKRVRPTPDLKFRIAMRIREALRSTSTRPLGITDWTWSVAQSVDAALADAPAMPTETPPDRRRTFIAVDGGKRVSYFDSLP
jgi:hypothetical protein